MAKELDCFENWPFVVPDLDKACEKIEKLVEEMKKKKFRFTWVISALLVFFGCLLLLSVYAFANREEIAAKAAEKAASQILRRYNTDRHTLKSGSSLQSCLQSRAFYRRWAAPYSFH